MHSVLIVDNEPIIRKGLVSLVDWENLGCQAVGSAADGQQALDIMAKTPVDILVTDIRMPGMDGLALTREVRRLYPDTKIILVTAFSEFEYAQEALRQQVVDFIIKPTSKEKMSAAIQRAQAQLQTDDQQQALKRVLHQKHQDNLGLQQKLFIESLLSGSRLSLIYVRTQSARLQLKLENALLVCARVLPQAGTDEAGMAQAMEEAMSYLSTLCQPDSLILLPTQVDIFLAVYVGENQRQLPSVLKEYIALVDNMAEFNVQLGVSSPVIDAMQLNEAAQQAREALFYLSYENHPAFLEYEQVPRVTETTAQILRDILREVSEAFRSQDIQAVEKAMAALQVAVTAHRIPLPEVRRCMLLLYNICINTLMDYDLNAALDQGVMPRPEQFLQNTQAENLSMPFLDLARQIFLMIKGNNCGQEGPVRYIEQYIRNNLDKDLSLKHLASLVHLSPSYLSREFKRLAGRNLSVFIAEERILKAQKLLEEGALKNYEIAKQVGYEDPVYFSRAFKKATGLKPSEYRQQT